MTTFASEKILFVDDELNLLEGIKRQFRNQFNLETSSSPGEGLQLIALAGPFAVVIADMRMPAMDGVKFLGKVKELAPQTVRMMLTGNADQQTAADAVNEGSIFRFLTKPILPEVLSKAIRAGIEQYRLIVAEKDLLEKTLSGSVKVLTETLGLVNPVAFGRASRIQRYVHHMTTELKLPEAWRFELAAMLSQIGCVTLPVELLEKVSAGQTLSKEEQQLFASHPSVGSSLLEKIPRLEAVAAMIGGQQQPYSQSVAAESADSKNNEIAVGAQLLKIALDLDEQLLRGAPIYAALQNLRKQPSAYNFTLLNSLDTLEIREAEAETKTVRVNELKLQMILDEDVRAKNGLLLLRKGHEVNYSVLVMLRRYASGIGVEEPFRVRVPVYEYGTRRQQA